MYLQTDYYINYNVSTRAKNPPNFNISTTMLFETSVPVST